MSTNLADAIQEKVRAFLLEQQEEVLEFVNRSFEKESSARHLSYQGKFWRSDETNFHA